MSVEPSQSMSEVWTSWQGYVIKGPRVLPTTFPEHRTLYQGAPVGRLDGQFAAQLNALRLAAVLEEGV